MAQSKNWCFTLNNPTDVEEVALLKLCETLDTAIVGREVGESGTPHLQGLLVFATNHRLAGCKKLITRANWSITRNFEQSVVYCRKDGNMFVDKLKPKAPGKRTDLAELIEALTEGGLPLAKRRCPEQLIKFPSGCRLFCSLSTPSPDDRLVRVVAYIGPPGTGKSRAAISQILGGNGARVLSPQKPGDHMWFDAYRGQDVLVLDEFRGTIPYGFLLSILDRGPIDDLPIKNGTTAAHWTKVIITSNKPWTEWYPGEDLGPLQRRLKTGGIYTSPPWDLGVLPY